MKTHADKKNIVVVDEDEALQEMLGMALEAEGYHVVKMSNGNDALKYILNSKNRKLISLVILEKLLHDLDGIEVLKKISEHEKNLPIIFLSVLASENDIIEGLKEGAIDYITKPFHLPILLEKIKRIISFTKQI